MAVELGELFFKMVLLINVANTKTAGTTPRSVSTSVSLGIPKGSTGRCPLTLRGVRSNVCDYQTSRGLPLSVVHRIISGSNGRHVAIALGTLRGICFGCKRRVGANCGRSSYRFCVPNF